MTGSPFTPLPNKQIHPSLQFLSLIGVTLFFIIVGAFVGRAIIELSFGAGSFDSIMTSNLSSPGSQKALWIFQLVSTTLPLLLSPVVFSYLVVKEPEDYLKTSFHFPWLLILIVFLVMMLSSPLMEFIANLNAKMSMPKWALDDEKVLQKESDSMMQMSTIWSMFFDLAFIGLVTAIAEEFLFRGCLQTILIQWLKNKHVAIWLTAILFSAFHMEFLGFFPRLMLGLFFGYFTLWSGSIWPSVWAHFVNNGTVVVITYLYQNKLINISPDDQQIFTNGGYIFSFIATLVLMFIYRYISNKMQAADINGEELD